MTKRRRNSPKRRRPGLDSMNTPSANRFFYRMLYHQPSDIHRWIYRQAFWLAPLLLVLAVVGAWAIFAADGKSSAPAAEFLEKQGIRYWLEVRKEPWPLRIHHLKIDLANPGIELASVLADDPDGDGPATAKLEPPMSMAKRSRALALVNANPWQGLPGPDGKRDNNWREGQPVEILGLAVSGGTVRSRVNDSYCGFWTDAQGKPHIGNPADISAVREGVAGFKSLVRDGQNLHKPDEKRHPRTALGLDASGRWLYLVVVDGRQEGYSEGMSLQELAAYMIEIGCRDAVNLDGGGSSLMILADEKGALRVTNDPSTKANGASVARPTPVGLAVRGKK